MQIVNTTTGQLITREALEAAIGGTETLIDVNPVTGEETSTESVIEFKLPRDLSGVDLSEFGAALVQASQPPDIPAGQMAVLDGAELVGGIWQQKWRVEDVPVEVPQSVTMRQAQLALHAACHLDAVEAAIEAAGVVAQIEWKAAKDVHRDSLLVAMMAGLLDLDKTALDALFVDAGAR